MCVGAKKMLCVAGLNSLKSFCISFIIWWMLDNNVGKYTSTFKSKICGNFLPAAYRLSKILFLNFEVWQAVFWVKNFGILSKALENLKKLKKSFPSFTFIFFFSMRENNLLINLIAVRCEKYVVVDRAQLASKFFLKKWTKDILCKSM